ncbi:VCBS domain-containing protein [Mycolicibacterium sp. S2-37]|uniref:Ig-like domain-containing protein n=1 Tax=Mycolicibacterium sp. S2-37 TaxID=2810297 RepID=UPI001A94416A|nr:Ig-like domain-containing protein [Mycolicibacterium sp. S2-37]MBO0677830.1 VCBS domain-containing protein [Mycolicibacterium sp. S2-37]
MGTLAVALGVGAAVATGLGAAVAHAEPSISSESSNDSGTSSSPERGSSSPGAADSPSGVSRQRRSESAALSGADADGGGARTESDAAGGTDLDGDEEPAERAAVSRSGSAAGRDVPAGDRQPATVVAESTLEAGASAQRRLSGRAQHAAAASVVVDTRDARLTEDADVRGQDVLTPAVPSAVVMRSTTPARPVAARAATVTAAMSAPFATPAPGNPIRPLTPWAMVELVGREIQRSFVNRRPEVFDQEVTLHVEDAAGSSIPISFDAYDPDGDLLAYGVPVSRGLGGPAHGRVSVDQANGTFVYTPDPDFGATGGTDWFAVTAFDDIGGVHSGGPFSRFTRGLQNTALVTVRVPARIRDTPVIPTPAPPTPPNEEPPATGQFTIDTTDAATGTLTGSIAVPGAGSRTLTFSAPAETDRGAVTIDAATGRFTYRPTDAARHAAAATGATEARRDTFAVTVTDSEGRTTTVPVTVQITPANTPPEGSYEVETTDAGTGAVTGTVTGIDADLDTLAYSAPADTGRGTVEINTATGRFVYTPTDAARHAAAASGGASDDRWDTFTVTINDGHGGTTSVPVMVDISPTNVPPAAEYSVGEPDQDTGAVSGTIIVTDEDGDTVTFNGPVSTANGVVTIDPVTGAFTYTPTEEARRAVAGNGDYSGGTGLQTITLTEDSQITQGTFGGPSRGLTHIDQLTESDADRNYVATFFTAAESQTYYFGQTGAPVDTVIILYDGVFNPESPATNAITINDDTPAGNHAFVGAIVEPGGCGTTSYCPQVQVELTAGQVISLVVTTFSQNQPLGLPQSFYANGAGGFSTVSPADTFDVTVDDGHGGVTTITVTVPIDPLPTEARRSTQL